MCISKCAHKRLTLSETCMYVGIYTLWNDHMYIRSSCNPLSLVLCRIALNAALPFKFQSLCWHYSRLTNFLFSTNVFGKLDLSLKYFSLVFGGDRGKYQVSSLQNSSSLFRHFFFVFFKYFFFCYSSFTWKVQRSLFNVSWIHNILLRCKNRAVFH